MKRIALLFCALSTLLTQGSCSSDVDTFITSLNEREVKSVAVIDKLHDNRTLFITSPAARKQLYLVLKKTTKVNFNSVSPQLHDRFYIIKICKQDTDCQEIELVRTEGKGIILAHVGSYYLRNDALLQVADSLVAAH